MALNLLEAKRLSPQRLNHECQDRALVPHAVTERHPRGLDSEPLLDLRESCSLRYPVPEFLVGLRHRTTTKLRTWA